MLPENPFISPCWTNPLFEFTLNLRIYGLLAKNPLVAGLFKVKKNPLGSELWLITSHLLLNGNWGVSK